MAGADPLARHPGGVTRALAAWERRLRPSIGHLQGNGLPITSPLLLRRRT
ncbi:hypothetical protein [Nonomuraea rhodomycinica]|uniref:Uncharacterized protein n=1 Tax=Nonomuraea rhodomycinica TaxID=1712872 RepID=A0A7Y6IQF6_9ACTN|nr:hypothetical protein [Nonomuraea rhodomycinica]NUW41184.1 hypothetical protein [Nonomuraea rhodomycinica]